MKTKRYMIVCPVCKRQFAAVFRFGEYEVRKHKVQVSKNGRMQTGSEDCPGSGASYRGEKVLINVKVGKE